jgi:uncharacterized protein (DUF1697 family)
MRYVAFLRAINLAGKNVVPMPVLRDLFERFGFTDVKTYIQTGNVVFSTAERDAARIQRQIEQKLAKAVGFQVGVFVLTKAQLESAVKKNPFDPAKHDHKQQTHLIFLSAAPTKAQRDALMAKAEVQYRFAVHGRVLYYAYSREIVGNRKAFQFEKILGVTATARTWKVVDKMIELLDEQ